MTTFALGVEIGRRGDVPLLGHPIDDLLDQLLELRAGVGLIAVGGIAQQPFDRFVRQHAAIEQGVENRVMQRLHRLLGIVGPVGVSEAAGEQQVGQLGDQILEIEIVQLVAGEFRVSVLHA